VKITATSLPGVMLIEPQVFADERGYFMETWKRSSYVEQGIDVDFSQTNLSQSTRGVLRGLHYQWPQPQAKLVQVLQGRVYDVAVDIRRGSPNYLKWVGMELSDENHHQLYIPEGFAHGFISLSETVLLAYACSREYLHTADAAIAWNDPAIAIEWPLESVSLSAKDTAAPNIVDIPPGKLPEMCI